MNDEQLEAVVRLWGRDILRFCRITTGNREMGDDLYQDTMITLLEKQAVLEESMNVKSYAIAIALGLWRNRQKKLSRRDQLVPQDSLEALAELGLQPGVVDSPEQQLLQESQADTVRQMVAALPEKYRLPLQLHYSGDLPIRDIAKIMKLPVNTVKSRLHRSKQILKQKLEESERDRTAI